MYMLFQHHAYLVPHQCLASSSSLARPHPRHHQYRYSPSQTLSMIFRNLRKRFLTTHFLLSTWSLALTMILLSLHTTITRPRSTTIHLKFTFSFLPPVPVVVVEVVVGYIVEVVPNIHRTVSCCKKDCDPSEMVFQIPVAIVIVEIAIAFSPRRNQREVV